MTSRLPGIRSFQLRIALLSTLLSATVLLAFGLWSLGAARRTSLLRVDQSIRELGDRHLGMRQGPQHWEFVNESLAFVLGDLRDNPFILLVRDRDGNVLHQSENWPATLTTDQFPTPVELGFSEPPAPWAPFNRGGRGPFGGGWRGQPPGNGPNGPPPPQDQGPDGDNPFVQNPNNPRDPEQRGPRDFNGPPPGQQMQPGPPFGRQWQPGPPPDQQVQPGPPFGQQRQPGLPPGQQMQPGPPPGPPPKPLPIRTRPFFTIEAGGHKWRVGVMANPEVTLVLGLNLAPYGVEMDRLLRLFFMAVPAALLVIALGGWWLARRALRPVEALTRMAEGVTAQGLDRRIETGTEDAEFDRLIRVFNGMLDRLEKSFRQAVRFSADAAHELKTPLTILQGDLAQALQTAQPGSDQQETLSHLLDEVQRLKSITRKLLLLALADSGQLKPHREPVNLSEMVEALAEDIQVMGPGLHVDKKIEEDLWTGADPDLLRQVMQNLAGNCVKYNTPDGAVRLILQQGQKLVRLIVANTGPGIPEEDRERVFERFFRGDKAHNRRVDGMGLGLSLAREIARAHQGDLRLEEAAPGWTAFALVLPRLAGPPDSVDV